MEIKNKFAERLMEIRCGNNLTRKEMAAFLDVSDATVGFWEREGRKPSLDDLINISRLFDVTIDYLLGNSNEKKTNDFVDATDVLTFIESIHYKKVQNEGDIQYIDQLNEDIKLLIEKYDVNKEEILTLLRGNVEEKEYSKLLTNTQNVKNTLNDIKEYLRVIQSGSKKYQETVIDVESEDERTVEEIKYLNKLYPQIDFNNFYEGFIHNLYELKR